ncbi:MAG TPA: hypothetical protein VES88_12655 [Gemmatimonadaceae bacterium]|nr:hypothetical protein [Gemmatimonadaceae bacterium]
MSKKISIVKESPIGACCFAIALTLTAITRAEAQDSTSAKPTYESVRLETLVSEAARINALIPERLRAYRARIETEMSIALIDSAGRERTAQLEQIASDVRWRAADRYDQRVIGYRSQAIGPMFSMMSIFGGWTTPTLYGNRLQLGVTPTAEANTRTNTTELTVHPLSTSRQSYYRFEGGDTVVVLYSRGRRIPVVRVRVTPRSSARGNTVLFFGDMHLDADRRQIVRLRGRMVEVRNGKVTIKAGSRIPGMSGASFVELENVEVNGEYWLPAYQRTELQARIALFGEFRAIVRIVSRFHDYKPNDSSWASPAEPPPGSGHYLSFAPSDSLSRFNDWQRPLGAASTDAQYADFDDLAPGSWRTAGSATLRLQPKALGEVFRFNRIEGVFTGLAAEHHFRDAAPGLSIRGSLGWAWSEKTARGSVGIQRSLGRTTFGVRLDRSLVHTNDFQLPLSGGATTPALLGSVDDFDYLDRKSATAFITRRLGAQRRSLVRLEVGPASDNVVSQNASKGLYVQGDGFRPNRGILPGNFVRSVAALEISPQVSGLFVDRGVGATIQYDRADGDLSWQRLELRTAARRELGPFQLYARGDAGTLIGDPAPQVMFEIGSSEGLSAYDYKEFAGDRAGIVRTVIGYTFPFLRAPMRLPSQLIAPGIAPGIAAGIHAAWTEVSSPAAETALLLLGSRLDTATSQLIPLSRPTDGIRASAEVLLTFFSGALAAGVARPIDHAGPWKFTGRIGQGF